MLVDGSVIDPEEAITNFRELFSDMPVKHHITHNGLKFDLKFLRCATGKISQSFVENAIDTAAIYKGQKLNMELSESERFLDFANRVLNTRAYGIKYSIATACEELGIDTEGITMHRALGDCILTNEIYKKLCL